MEDALSTANGITSGPKIIDATIIEKIMKNRSGHLKWRLRLECINQLKILKKNHFSKINDFQAEFSAMDFLNQTSLVLN